MIKNSWVCSDVSCSKLIFDSSLLYSLIISKSNFSSNSFLLSRLMTFGLFRLILSGENFKQYLKLISILNRLTMKYFLNNMRHTVTAFTITPSDEYFCWSPYIFNLSRLKLAKPLSHYNARF